MEKREIKFDYEGITYTVIPYLDGADGVFTPHGKIKFIASRGKEYEASFRVDTTASMNPCTSVDSYTMQPWIGGGIRRDTQYKLTLQAQKAVDSVPEIFNEILLHNNRIIAWAAAEKRRNEKREAEVSAAASRTEVLAWWLKTIKKLKGIDYALDPVTLLGINRCLVTKEAVKEFFNKELSVEVLNNRLSRAEEEIQRLTRIAESINALLCTTGNPKDEDFEDYWACVEEEIANEKTKNNGQ